MLDNEKQKALIATIIAKNTKVVIPGGIRQVEGATALVSDSWNPYIDATDDGLHFKGFPGKEAEELAFVGATQGVTVAENGLVVGMAALTNASLGMISYRGNVSLGSDTQKAETVTRVDNNVISKVTTGGAEMSSNFIKIKESSKEEVVKFEASDGYKLETRVLDKVDEATVLELLQEAADHLKNNPGATFGFFTAVPTPNNSDDLKPETEPVNNPGTKEGSDNKGQDSDSQTPVETAETPVTLFDYFSASEGQDKNKEAQKFFENKDAFRKNFKEIQKKTGTFDKDALDPDDDEDNKGGTATVVKNGGFTFGGTATVVKNIQDMTRGKGYNSDNKIDYDDDDEEVKEEDNGGDWIDNGDEVAEEEGEDREIVETRSEVKEEVKETFTLKAEDEQLIKSWIVDNGANTMRVKLNSDLQQPMGIKGLQLTEWQKSTLTLIRWLEKHGFKTCTQFKKTFCNTKRLQLEAAGIRLTFIQVKGDYDRQLPYFSMNGGQKRVYFDLDDNRNFVFK